MHGKTREVLRLERVARWDHGLRLIRWGSGYRGTEVGRRLRWLGLGDNWGRMWRRIR